MQIEELDLDVRTYNAVKRTGCDTVEELRQMLAEDPDNVRRNLGSRTFDRITEMLETEEKNMIEFTTKLPPAPAEPTTPEYLAAFNLNARIHYCKDSVERGLAEMCIGIEQMRDGKQYKVLGYSNFEEYCQTEFGFTRKNGERYASIGKMLSGENATSMSQNVDSLGMTKLSLLAKLDEPTREVLTEAVDVENATVKELKAHISALQRDKDKLETETADLGQRLDLAEEKLSKSECLTKAKQDELDDLRAGNKRRYDTLFNKIKDLNAQLAEAKEAASQEVAVEDTSRIEELEKELADCKRQLAERPMVQEALPGDGGERRRGEYSAISNAVVNALEDLMDFLEDNDHCKDFHYFASRAKEKLREYNNKVNDMLAKEET